MKFSENSSNNKPDATASIEFFFYIYHEKCKTIRCAKMIVIPIWLIGIQSGNLIIS